MRKSLIVAMFAAAVLSACSNEPQENEAREIVYAMEPSPSGEAPVNEFGFMEAMHQGPDPFGEQGPTARQLANDAVSNLPAPDESVERPNPTGEARIAYSYSFGFSIKQERIPDLQQAHVKLCEALGTKCRILRMSQASTDGYDGYGELRLQVEAKQARAFGDALRKPAEELGGEQVSSLIDGEDLSETIIDTEARLASRLVLREKLTAILKSNRGSVDELVKAEKAVADVNEEIDAARSRLEELRNRIRYSAVAIEYNPYLGQSDTGLVRPVWVAITSIGSTLGKTIAILVYVATALVPITIFLFGLGWLWRRSGLTIWHRRRNPPTELVSSGTSFEN